MKRKKKKISPFKLMEEAYLKARKKDQKVTIKDNGFIEWYLYQIENNALFLIIQTSVLSAIASVITTIIIRSC